MTLQWRPPHEQWVLAFSLAQVMRPTFALCRNLGSPFSFRLDVEQMDGIATSVTDNHPTQNSSTSTRLSNNCSNKYRNIVFLFSN